MINRFFALILLLFLIPVFIILFCIVKLTSKGPFLFRQLRTGKNRKPFWMYKIRTMVYNAELLKTKFRKLNEADGPVFKIYNDPRYTRFGKLLSHTGIDELPQLINVVKGEMCFVGPRPLPVEEASRIPAEYSKRFSVQPGITSFWVVKGSHKLTFDQWMKLDLYYVHNKSVMNDLIIAFQTINLILKGFLK